MVYFPFNLTIVMEYGASVREKFVPNPSTSAVTGTIFRGSVIEFVSSGLLALIAIIWPFGSTVATPSISTRTGCATLARFTRFR